MANKELTFEELWARFEVKLEKEVQKITETQQVDYSKGWRPSKSAKPYTLDEVKEIAKNIFREEFQKIQETQELY